MNNQENKRTIILAADERYSEKILSTIKSICFHNKNIKFYLLNRDYSSEWFKYVNSYLKLLNSEIIDIKISSEIIKKYQTYSHISSDATYFRYFISDLINEDKVLYLDCDIIVNGSLDPLFDIDINNYFLAAVSDDIAQNIHGRSNDFNAGVMLINNKLWKEYKICEKSIDLSNQYEGQMPDGDQTILNLLFKDNWLELHHIVNYQIGGEFIYSNIGRHDLIKRKSGEIPIILHFNTENKPWLPIYNLPFREYYWFYYQLSWNEILKK